MAVNWGIFLELIILGLLAWMIWSIGKILVFQKKEVKRLQSEGKSCDDFLCTRGEPLNLLIMILILAFMMIYIPNKAGFDLKGNHEDYPAFIMASVPAGIIVIILSFNFIQWLRKKPKLTRWGLKSEQDNLTHKDKRKTDLMRKGHHLLGMALIFGALSLADRYMKSNLDDPIILERLATFWGAKDGLNFLERTFQREEMPLAKTIIVLWMYGEALMLITFEITRLSKHVRFPFHKTVQATMRYKELDTFAALSHYAVGYLFAAVMLPPIMFLASMCLLTFADPIASTIGINWGEKLVPKRFPWNGKSVEGLVAGSAAAIITMIPFVGVPYAFMGGLIFAIADLITPKPIEISDNMILPIMCTFGFIILSVLGIPATNMFGF